MYASKLHVAKGLAAESLKRFSYFKYLVVLDGLLDFGCFDELETYFFLIQLLDVIYFVVISYENISSTSRT